MTPLRPGAVGRTRAGERLLLLEPAGSAWVAVPYPVVEHAPVEVVIDPGGFVVDGLDEAAARVLQSRRRTARAAVREEAAPAPVGTAMVLCAGLGLRLRPLTERLPKPAVPFFGAPLVRYGFALLAGVGVRRVVINTHHLPRVMERVAREEADRLGLELQATYEPQIRGTGGGVREAKRWLESEPFLLLNGDAFMSLDLAALLARHRARGAAATMAVAPMPPEERFGAVEATAQGAVRRISGHGPGGERLQPWHFLGAHVLEPEVFDFIPAGEVDVNHLVYPAMIEAGRRVEVCAVSVGAWADMGTPARYLQACQEVMTGLCDLAPLGVHAPLTPSEQQRLREGGVAARVSVHRSARVGRDVRLDQAQVGPGCHLGDGAQLRRAAVLAGTRIAAGEHVEDALAFEELRLR